MTHPETPLGPDGAEFAARIIGALGQLMLDFNARDQAVQSAVSDLTNTPDTFGINMTDLQHIDLVTQTHADLARFLPKLAESLRQNEFVEQSLAGSLTLRSLQDVLLRPLRPEVEGQDQSAVDDTIDPGDMDLF